MGFRICNQKRPRDNIRAESKKALLMQGFFYIFFWLITMVFWAKKNKIVWIFHGTQAPGGLEKVLGKSAGNRPPYLP
jgi:hypothetical protein